MFKKMAYHIKNGGVKELIKMGYRHILIFFSPAIIRIFNLVKKKNNVVFSHFDGKAYGGNPGVICDGIIKLEMPYGLIWISDRQYRDTIPAPVKWVPNYSLRQLWALSTSKVWVDDCRKGSYIRKKNDQYYIQTWHGGGPCLKKIEADALDVLPNTYIKDAKNDSSMVNLLVSGCKWRTSNYKTAFWYGGEILECGTPTADVYSENPENIRNNIKNIYCIDGKKRIALYAPTFRSTHDVDCYKMDFDAICNALGTRFGGEWCLAIRLHPSIMNYSDFITYTDTIINVSMHPNFEELLIAADVLITDYSACMFEAYELQKNVFIYAKDLKHYMENERGFYFALKDLPADICMTSKDLVNNILEFNEEQYKQKADLFVNKIGYFPFGVATSSIVDRIIDVMEDKLNDNWLHNRSI